MEQFYIFTEAAFPSISSDDDIALQRDIILIARGIYQSGSAAFQL